MIETKHIFNRNTKISYKKSGKGQSLILLHGNSQSSKLYEKITPNLVNNGYQVFAIDSRGHGESGRPRILCYSDMADDVTAVINHENLINPILFGFSDGGVTGITLSIQAPETLKQLIVCGIRLSLKGVKPLLKLFWRISYFFTRLPRLKLLLTQPEITPAQLAEIKTPTVIVRAQHDQVILSHSMTAAKAIPNCELIILPKETHASYMRNQKKLLQLLAQILPKLK